MREAHLGFAALFTNLKNNVRALPLILVFDKVKAGVQYVPDNPLAGDEFGYLLFGTVRVWNKVSELGAEFVSVAFDFTGPPATNIVDGVEGLFWRLAYRKRSYVILTAHFPGFGNHFFQGVRLAFAFGNQIAQAALDVRTPRIGTDIEALIFGNQSLMREADFRFIALL